MRVNGCSIRGVVLCGKQSEDSWEKKADYQEGLEKSYADSAARSRDSYMKNPEKSHAQSRESYKKNLEKNRNDSAARSRESYLKNPENSRARSRESYIKDPEKSRADSAARSRQSYNIGIGNKSYLGGWTTYFAVLPLV